MYTLASTNDMLPWKTIRQRLRCQVRVNPQKAGGRNNIGEFRFSAKNSKCMALAKLNNYLTGNSLALVDADSSW